MAKGGYFARVPDYGYKTGAGNYALINGISLYYEVYGTGHPLLLLHGNGQTVDFLCMQIPTLAQHFQVIAVDSRGHGKSGAGTTPFSFELFAADMDALLQHLYIDRAHIVGWSDGGNTGLAMAMLYPNRVAKVVTMGSNIFMDTSVVDEAMIAEARQMKQSVANSTEPENKRIARLVDLVLYHPQYRFEDLQKITCPVLVMAGETDVIKRAHTENMAAHIPKGRLLIAKGETHHYPVKNPDGFNRTVIDFLNEEVS